MDAHDWERMQSSGATPDEKVTYMRWVLQNVGHRRGPILVTSAATALRRGPLATPRKRGVVTWALDCPRCGPASAYKLSDRKLDDLIANGVASVDLWALRRSINR
jgi:hypothetical protein